MELLSDSRFEEAFGAADCGSRGMRQGVCRWLGRYYDGGLLSLPYTMVRKLSRAVLCEYQPQGFAQRLPAREALELALMGGESYLKPGEAGWQAVSRGSILVFQRDDVGEPLDVGLVERRRSGRYDYTLLERRTLDENGILTVTHRLFKGAQGELGREVSLKAHGAWAHLPEQYVWPHSLGGVGLVRVKTPMANCVDGSQEGVSLYAAAEGLLDAIEENESQLRGEFQKGQSRLVVSRDMLREGQLADDLFVGLDESPDCVGITVFSPQLREQSYLNRQQAYLRSLENLIGLKRGLLSQVEAVDRTATEITSSEGEYMGLIRELQGMWRRAADQAAVLETALTGKKTKAEMDFGDGVL